MEINNLLLNEQLIWEEKIYSPFLKGKEGSISVPFSFGVSGRYIDSSKRLLIVGQEAKDFGTDYKGWRLEDIQQWDIRYLERQLYDEYRDEMKYNGSPFWDFFRTFSKEGFAPCWNNVDKAHRYSDGKTTALSYEDEYQLSASFQSESGFGGLLQKEIKIAAPLAIVFITGPHYDRSICTSFNLPLNTLESHKPTSDKPVHEVSDLLGITVPAFWTYHPNYLNFKGLTIQAFDFIKSHI